MLTLIVTRHNQWRKVCCDESFLTRSVGVAAIVRFPIGLLRDERVDDSQ
jgi:hypothetical protein